METIDQTAYIENQEGATKKRLLICLLYKVKKKKHCKLPVEYKCTNFIKFAELITVRMR